MGPARADERLAHRVAQGVHSSRPSTLDSVQLRFASKSCSRRGGAPSPTLCSALVRMWVSRCRSAGLSLTVSARGPAVRDAALASRATAAEALLENSRRRPVPRGRIDVRTRAPTRARAEDSQQTWCRSCLAEMRRREPAGQQAPRTSSRQAPPEWTPSWPSGALVHASMRERAARRPRPSAPASRSRSRISRRGSRSSALTRCLPKHC